MKKKYEMINTLYSIVQKYTTYLIDIGGVLCDGKKPFSEAITVINNLIQQKKQIIFLSNNPRPSSFIHKQLTTFGITGNYHSVTSGDILHHTLNTTLKNKAIYHLGRNRQHALLEGLDIQLVCSPHDADTIILSCFVEGNENHNAFDEDLIQILASQKPVYCPNPDRIALEGTMLRYPSGYFAHKFIQMGGTVTYLGKPYRNIYEFITTALPDLSFNPKTTLMIGDNLETDILGAINFDIDSLLLLSGVTGLYAKNNPDILHTTPYKPTYVMEVLR
jgi:HAD superfamily hydrolase (TIGR01459 family)